MNQLSSYIFIADDDADDRELLQQRLIQLNSGVTIDFTTRGPDTLSFLKSCSNYHLPDLILLDYELPCLNAGQVLEMLEKIPGLASVPKIVWSVCAPPLAIETCQRFGAEQFFIKPFSVGGFDTIAAYIDNRCRGHNLPS